MMAKVIDYKKIAADAKNGWREQLVKSRGKTAPYVANAVTILSRDPAWDEVLGWDAFSVAVTMLRPPPWDGDDAPSRRPEAGDLWADEDDTRASAWLARHYGIQLSGEAMYRAVRIVADKRQFHPIKQFLEAATWDQQPRLERWLTTYLGVEETDYSRSVGRWWMTSAVARIYAPGCKVDHVLILEGHQGLGKSTALQILAGGPAYFSDTPFDIGTKDAFVALRGTWIQELAELQTLMRVENAAAKGFFSSGWDNFRAPYAHRNQKVPRQCVFAGSVNPDQYLRDETGARRYWPVKCLLADYAALEADRAQLWAEALAYYLDGAKWYPDTSDERRRCAEEQSDRYQSDEWETRIGTWLDGWLSHPHNRARGFVTGGEVLEQALKLEPGKWDKWSQMRVGTCLIRLGWKRRQRREGLKRTWVYEFANDNNNVTTVTTSEVKW